MVDNRQVKEDIDVLRRENNRLRETPYTVGSFLQAIYSRIVWRDESSDDDLLLVLYDIQMDDAQKNEACAFYMSADFFRGSNGNYRLITCLDTISEVRSNWSLTRMFRDEARKRLIGLLSAYAVQKPGATGIVYTEAEAVGKRERDKAACAICSTVDFKKGVYYTVDQFMNNTPVDTGLIRWSSPSETYVVTHFYYKNGKGRRGDRVGDGTYFAIYDGKDWWANDMSTARKMKFKDGDFSTILFFKADITGNNYGTPMVLGGLVGGALAGAAIGATAAALESRQAPLAIYRARFNPSVKRFVAYQVPR